MRILWFSLFGGQHQVWFPGCHRQACCHSCKDHIKIVVVLNGNGIRSLCGLQQFTVFFLQKFHKKYAKCIIQYFTFVYNKNRPTQNKHKLKFFLFINYILCRFSLCHCTKYLLKSISKSLPFSNESLHQLDTLKSI